MGVKFSNKNISNRIKVILKRCSNLEKPMKKIAVYMKNETLRNFDEEHSYDGIKWEKSKRAREQGGKTLTNTGNLYKNINASFGKNYARVGTNVIYARVLNQGADKGKFGKVSFTVRRHTRKIKSSKNNGEVNVKSHTRRANVPWGNIPAYRYMGLSKEAKARYGKILLDYILKK